MHSEVSMCVCVGNRRVYLHFTICPVITVSVDTRANNELLIEYICDARAAVSLQ